jgi:hypothetical protein
MEISEQITFCLDPLRGFTFDFLDQFGHRDRSSKSAQDMNMVCHTADTQNRTFEVVANSAEVMVHLVADSGIREQWPPVLREKTMCR